MFGNDIGSSPQARGTRNTGSDPCTIFRFIPAGAGNTEGTVAAIELMAVHPRRRGEHRGRRIPPRPLSGSSPQARGTPWITTPIRPGWRFIPAGAGNTRIWPPRLQSVAVHPRRRGEHQRQDRHRSTAAGSSPQARGTPSYNAGRAARDRFIPAGAGNTTVRGLGGRPASVHPRRRGEHSTASPAVYQDSGSSPQARGTLMPLTTKAASERFIPAGAGNTHVRPGCFALQ